MLKHCRVLSFYIVFVIFSYAAINAQTKNYKDVILDGKPAKLNLETGIVTFKDGTAAKSLEAKKLRDSVRASNTVINKNLILDKADKNKAPKKKVSVISSSEIETKQKKASNSLNYKVLEASSIVKNRSKDSIPENSITSEQTLIAKTEDIDISKDSAVNMNDSTDHKKIKAPNLLTNTKTSNQTHIVSKGETLFSISRRYDTTVEALKQMNDLESSNISVDQILIIDSQYTSQKVLSSNYWIVAEGDTLYNIAKRNNTSVDTLKSINGLNSNLIKIGQKLRLK